MSETNEGMEVVINIVHKIFTQINYITVSASILNLPFLIGFGINKITVTLDYFHLSIMSNTSLTPIF